MNSKKILFSDLDGTLLDNQKKISERNRRAIQKMLDLGHYFVIATGRPVASAANVVQELGLTMPSCYMIAFNGAVVFDCSAECVLAERTLPIECVEYLFEEAKRFGLHVQTYSRTHVLTEVNDRELQYYTSTTNMPYKQAGNVFDILESEPNKVLLADLDGKSRLEAFRREHLNWEKDQCNSFFSSDLYLEYCPAKTDKGTGIRFLTKLLDIPVEQTVAVGDAQNDIPMIREASLGIAMKNGSPEILRAADAVTLRDNEHDAIADVIEEYIL